MGTTPSNLTAEETAVYKIIKTQDGISASKVSQDMGFSGKTKKVDNLFSSLLSKKLVKQVETGGYVGYAVVMSKSADKTSRSARTVKSSAVRTVRSGGGFTDLSISANRPDADSFEGGYYVKYLDSGNVLVGVPATENTEKAEREIGPTERVLVLNKNTFFIVDTPESIINAVMQYTYENSIGSYAIRDVMTNTMAQPSERGSDINSENALIFLTIERHNKAG